MERLICLAIGYCFGLIQTAMIYGRLKGFDIRKQGSGNAGTTNMLRVKGVKAGLIVFAGDFFKGLVAVLVTTAIFRTSHSDTIYLLKVYTALGVVLGHDYPFYLKFKGGKGIATTAGFMNAFHWSFIPVGVCMFFIPFLITHYVSLGSLMLYAGLFIQTVICGQMGVFAGSSQATLNEMYVVIGGMTALAYFQHRANIGRLIHHNERKTYLTKKNKV
jgi:glycerol-3-phosphate acyltransferase PlsY